MLPVSGRRPPLRIPGAARETRNGIAIHDFIMCETCPMHTSARFMKSAIAVIQTAQSAVPLQDIPYPKSSLRSGYRQLRRSDDVGACVNVVRWYALPLRRTKTSRSERRPSHADVAIMLALR